ncbi:MAG: hypothetical protein EBR88_03685, partial [Betaproteobacteria bacterium]|nr:hypothetical protein [Betaproteobacteria bacterium]
MFSSDDTKNTADATDTIFDATSTDNDTATFVTNQDVTDVPKITNIENLVFNVDATTTGDNDFEVDLTNASGVKTVAVNVVRALSGVNSVTITALGDGVTVSTDNRITTVDLTSEDGGDQNVKVAAVGSSGAPVTVTIAKGGDDTGDNVITAAGHVDVTTDATGAVTVTAEKSAVVDAADAAIVIATAKDGDLEADASAAVIAQLAATGDITVTDGGTGSLTVTSSAGDVDVDATTATKTVITAAGDV